MEFPRILKRIVWPAAVVLVATFVLWYAGSKVFPLRYSEAQIATSSYSEYQTVLSEIQATSSFPAILALAGNSNLNIEQLSGDGFQSALITDPKSGEVLVAVTQYTDTFPTETSTASSTFHPCPAWGCNGPPLRIVTSTFTPSSTPTSTFHPCPAWGCNGPPPRVFSPTSTISTSTSPTVMVSASPSIVTLGGSSVLTWSSANTTSCTASGAWSGDKSISGSSAETPSSIGLQNYDLTCIGSSGTASADTYVVVLPVLFQPLINFFGSNSIDMVSVSTAYAQSAGGNPVVIGNDTGKLAECSLAGSDDTANILVYPNGQIYGVGGNFNFSLGSSLSDGSNPTVAAAASNALSAITALEGPQPVDGQTNNQLIVETNDSVADPNEAGVAVSVSTIQPDGTFDNSCTANLMDENVINYAATENLTSASEGAMTNVIEHEMLHCLGLAHNDDPGDIMNPAQNPFDPAAPAQVDAAEVQYLKDLVAGKSIQVDPDSCDAACPEGQAAVVSAGGGGECVEESKLCGNSPNSIWNEQIQACQSCPTGTTANLNYGTCIQNNQQNCALLGMQYDPTSDQCVFSQSPTCSANDEGNGSMTCAYGNGTSCTCKPTGIVECQDSDGNTVSDPGNACQGNCQTGQIQLSDGSCITNCSQNPNDPSCQGSNACVQDPTSDACMQYCVQNPDDSLCSTEDGDDYCAQNPSDPDCASYCAENPSDPSCVTGTSSGGGNDGTCTLVDQGVESLGDTPLYTCND